MGIAAQLATIYQGFATIASFPELKRTPIVMGESDPKGCAACQGPQLAYRNGSMYSSYTAASFARIHDVAARHGVDLEGALTWAFEFEDQPYFAGFRALASNGIALPVLNVFRMFSRMGGQRVAADSSAQVPLDTTLKEGVRGAPDVAAFAGAEPDRVAVMVWHATPTPPGRGWARRSPRIALSIPSYRPPPAWRCSTRRRPPTWSAAS
jgi:xylan 1,4-beta-xylosidase